MASSAEQQDERATSTVYVWPLIDGMRFAVHVSELSLTREQLSGVGMRVRYTAKSVFPGNPGSSGNSGNPETPENSEGATPWILVHILNKGSKVEVDVSDDPQEAARDLLKNQGLKGIGSRLRPVPAKLDAFVVFYESQEDEESRVFLADSPADTANVVRDALRSANVVYLKDADTMAIPHFQKFIARM